MEHRIRLSPLLHHDPEPGVIVDDPVREPEALDDADNPLPVLRAEVFIPKVLPIGVLLRHRGQNCVPEFGGPEPAPDIGLPTGCENPVDLGERPGEVLPEEDRTAADRDVDGSRGKRDIVDVARENREAAGEAGLPDVPFGEGKHLRRRVKERDGKVARPRKRYPERSGAAADVKAPPAGYPAPLDDLFCDHRVDRCEDGFCDPVHILRSVPVEPAWRVSHLLTLRDSESGGSGRRRAIRGGRSHDTPGRGSQGPYPGRDRDTGFWQSRESR